MLAPEGYSTIAVVFAISIFAAFGLLWIAHWLVWVGYFFLILLCSLILYFFRDPKRDLPEDPDLIVAPADGKVVQIRKEKESAYIKKEVTRISIFLSPLDVHVNRVPATGKLEYVEYFPGKYLMAWEDHASELNERAHFGVLHPNGTRLMFKQITGFLARRIQYHIKEGDQLTVGQRFGIMKFGSRMDILIPEGIEILVREGDRTVAGESLIGRFER